MPRSLLLLLSAVNLVIGTAAIALAPILAIVAQGLAVSVAAAGQSMTAYAVSTAVLMPLALLATGGWPRKRLLLAALGVFVIGTALCALATGLAMLIAGRVLMGLGTTFVPVAAAVAIALVDEQRRGRALALVFLGMSLAWVLGLPAVAWAGAAWGWRAAVAGTSAMSLLAWAAVAVVVPSHIAAPGASLAGLSRLSRRVPIWRVLGLTFAYFTASYVVFAYLGPVLQALVPMPAPRLALTLGLFGMAGAVGTLVGGQATDRLGARRTLCVQLGVLGAALALLPFAAGRWPALLAVLLLLALASFGMMPPQQARLAALAPRETPLALSLNTSVLYVGTAAGAALGGAMAPLFGLERLAWAGLGPLALGALLLAADRPEVQPVARHLQ